MRDQVSPRTQLLFLALHPLGREREREDAVFTDCNQSVQLHCMSAHVHVATSPALEIQLSPPFSPEAYATGNRAQPRTPPMIPSRAAAVTVKQIKQLLREVILGGGVVWDKVTCT